jgi:Holliday junction resolvase-like predicted endonuclease
MLQRRGLTPLQSTGRKDLLIIESLSADHQDEFYGRLKNYSFRLVLRDIIKRQTSFRLKELTRFCSLPKVKDHVLFLTRLGLVQPVEKNFRLVSGPVKSFGDTLEWFMAKVFEKEFLAEVLWGIRLKNSARGGDFDLVARMEGELVYVEVKSSPPKHIEQREVISFLDRIEDLLPHIAFFFEDTELRMKDKIVPMFEEAIQQRHGQEAPTRFPVTRLKNELFQINHQVFIVNSKRDVIENFRVCFRDYWRSRLRI